MIRLVRNFVILGLALGTAACTSSSMRPTTPLDTLKAYFLAIKKKDVKTMKSMLTQSSIKMAEDQAKAQNSTVDEILQRETLFSESQKTVEFKDEKIEGDSATIKVKIGKDKWDTIPFTKEGGEWKIDKPKYAEILQKEADEEMRKMDEEINRNRQADDSFPMDAVTPQGTNTNKIDDAPETMKANKQE